MTASRVASGAGLRLRVADQRRRTLACLPGRQVVTPEKSSDRPPSDLLGTSPSLGEFATPSFSVAFRSLRTSLNWLNRKLLTEGQMKMMNKVVRSLADVLMGREASPAERRAARRLLHIMALVAYPTVKIYALLESCDEADTVVRLTSDAELASLMAAALPLEAASPPSSLFFRAAAATFAFALAALNTNAAAHGLSVPDFQHLDALSSMTTAMDLVSSFAALFESSEELVSMVGELLQAVKDRAAKISATCVNDERVES